MTAQSSNGRSASRRSVLKQAGAFSAAAALGKLGSSNPASAAAQNESTLVVSSFYPLDTSSGWSEMIKGFETENPGVKIETQITPNAGEEYLQKLITQKVSDTLPDVIGVEVSPFPTFVANDLLQDLAPKLAADPEFNAESFFPKLLDRYTVGGKVYGIPYDCQPLVGVFINKGLFADAGISVPTKDWTWDEFMEAARSLTKLDGDRTTQFGLVTTSWQSWVYAFGGRLVNDVKRPTEVIINSPEAIKGMQTYVDLIVRDKISPSSQFLSGGGLSAADVFATGQAAMLQGGYWELVFDPSKFSNIDLGYVKFPDGPGEGTAYATGGTCYSVSSSSKQPDLAYEFVKYFMGMPGWQAAFRGAEGGVVYPPAFIPAYESEVFLQNPNPPVENIEINGEGAEFALFVPFDPVWQEIQTKFITPDVDLLTQGAKEVEPTMNEWAAKFTPMLTANQQ